jgi:hypothetical protein
MRSPTPQRETHAAKKKHPSYAQLFGSACPIQAEPKCLGKLASPLLAPPNITTPPHRE